MRIGEKLPSYIEDLVNTVTFRNSPEKIKVIAGSKMYMVVLSPLPEQECVIISGFDISDQEELGIRERKKIEHELLNANEKIREQSKELQELNEELQTQNEELQAQIEELLAQSEIIRNANETLRINEQWLQSIIDGSTDIILVKDLSGRYMLINNQLEKQLGMTREEIKGKNDYDIYSPEWAEYYRVHDLKVIDTGKPEQIEEIAELNNGLNVFLANRFLLYDSKCKPYALCCIAKNITERKRAEEALQELNETLEEKIKERTRELEKAYNSLKESEERLLEAQKMALIGNWDWDLVSNKMYWSDQMYNIFGVDPQGHEPDWDEVLNRVHFDDRDYIIKAIKESLEGKLHNINHRIIKPNGEESIVHVQSEVIFEEKRIPIRIRGTVQDITERKIADDKIRESEEKYRNIVETANEGIVLIDNEGKVTYANKKMTDMFGYTLEEGIGKSMWDFLSEESKPVVNLNMSEWMIGKNETYELKLKCKSGLPLWALVNDKPFFDKSGKYIGAMCMLTDITKRKEAEEALKKLEIAQMKEIHHRIKNNLQVISSLLDLQANLFKGRKDIKDSEVLKAFNQSIDRVFFYRYYP